MARRLATQRAARQRAPARTQRQAPAVSRRAAPTTGHPVLQLQSLVGNRGVAALLAPYLQRRPAVGAAFDARAVRNDLIRAIDTTPLPDVSPSFAVLSLEPRYRARAVDAAVAINALEGLTPEQVAEVRASYLGREGRTLDHDLFGRHFGGTNLSAANRARLRALLHYPRADAVMRHLDQMGVKPDTILAIAGSMRMVSATPASTMDTSRIRADAAELRQLLSTKPNEAQRERIMKLLRNEPGHNGELNQSYRDMFSTELWTDLRKYLPAGSAQRAELLAVGNRVGADALAIEHRRQEIAKINKAIEEVDKRAESAMYQIGSLSAKIGGGLSASVDTIVKKKLNEARNKQVAALQAILDSARQEAMDQADTSHKEAAGKERVAAILGTTPLGTAPLRTTLSAGVLTSREQAVIKAMESGAPPDIVASRLVQALATGKRTPAFVETELRGLRQAAARDAHTRLMARFAAVAMQLSPPERQAAGEAFLARLPVETEIVTTEYFAAVRTRYNEMYRSHGGFFARVPGDVFDSMIANLDKEAKTLKLATLVSGKGQISPLDELVFALDGSHKDIETVKNVLASKAPKERRQLEADYGKRTGRPLREVLVGPATVAKEQGRFDSYIATHKPNVSALLKAFKGKATGHDAFVVRELLDMPLVTDGGEEAKFLAEQADKERDWAISDSGFSGWLHDIGGSETRSLMEGSANLAYWHYVRYKSLVDAGRHDDAKAMLEQVRRDRARVRGDRAAYSESVDQFRAKLSAALTLAVDLAIMIVMPAAAPFLLTLGATVAGHVAVNLIVYGDKYSGEMLQRDVLGAVGSAAGSKLAQLAMAGKVANSAVQNLGDDLVIAASKTIAREAPEVASQSLLAMAKREGSALVKEGFEEVAGSVGGGIATGNVDISAGDIAQGIVTSKVGGGIRQVARPGQSGTGTTTTPTTTTPTPAPGTTTTPTTTPDPSRPPGTGPDPVKPPADTPAGTATDRRAADDPHATPDPTVVTGPPSGAVTTTAPGDLMGAWRAYVAARVADPRREVGLIYNHKLDMWAVVQGGGRETPIGDAIRNLGWHVDDVVVARHSHPIGEKGITINAHLLPSGQGGDLSGIRTDAGRREPGPGPSWEAIDVVTPNGPDRTWVLYDKASSVFTVDFPSPGARGGRDRASFANMADYHRWYLVRFGFEPGAAIPGRAAADAGTTATAPDAGSTRAAPGPPPDTGAGAVPTPPNLAPVGATTLKKRVGDPANPKDPAAHAELQRRAEQLSVRVLVEKAGRKRAKHEAFYAADALARGVGKPGEIELYLPVRNLSALTEMARHSRAAAEVLIERYRAMSHGQLIRAAEHDATAAHVLAMRVDDPTSQVRLGDPLGAGPQMDRAAEAGLIGDMWERRRAARDEAKQAEYEAMAAGNAADAATARQTQQQALTGGTVGALETDIPGVDPRLVRASPNAPQAADPAPDPTRPYQPPDPNPLFQHHAEDRLINEIAGQIQQAGLSAADLQGRTIRIAVDQAICQSCLSGIGQDKHAGVLVLFSRNHPGVRIEITDIRTGDFSVFEDGQRTTNRRRGSVDDLGR